MPYRNASQKAVLLLACCCVLMVAAVWPSTVAAQETPEPTEVNASVQFRKRIVEEWNWKPQSGIGLTTTEYAQKYLTRYFDEDGKWKGAESHYSLGQELSETPLVLFQTKTHDVLVFKQKDNSDNFFFIERSSEKIAFAEYQACSYLQVDAGFIDVDDDSSSEFRYKAKGTCANQSTGGTFQVYDLSAGFRKMLDATEYVDLTNCPDVLSDFQDPFPADVSRSAKGLLTYEFRVVNSLSMLAGGDCNWATASATVRRSCTYRPQDRQFVCSDTVIDEHSVSLSYIKADVNWERNAQNIRWVLKSADELRAKGFRFPEGFLERLPRHLPEGSQD